MQKDYQVLPAEPDGMPMPLLEVSFSVPQLVQGKSIEVLALVDSGADICFFSADLLRLFGVADPISCLGSPTTGEGAGSKFDFWEFPFQIEFDGTVICKRGALHMSDVNLLGRLDFFAHFKVEFDQRNEQFRLEPY